MQYIAHNLLAKIKWENPIDINLVHPVLNLRHFDRQTHTLAPPGKIEKLVHIDPVLQLFFNCNNVVVAWTASPEVPES